MMRRSTGFHRHVATRLIRQELIQTWSRHRSVVNNGAFCRNAANLKTALGKINVNFSDVALDIGETRNNLPKKLRANQIKSGFAYTGLDEAVLRLDKPPLLEELKYRK